MLQKKFRTIFLAFSVLLASCGPSPAEADNLAAQALALLDQNRIAEARLTIGSAIKARDDDPQYHLIRARIEWAAQSPEGAFNAYQDALALDATNLEALQGVSQLGLQIGRLGESLEATNRILSIDPNNQGALLVRGLIALVRKQYDEALEYADRVLAVAPLDEGGTILRARAAFLNGDPATARAALAEYTEALGTTAGIARTALEITRSQRNAAGMRDAFLELRDLVPDDNQLRVDEANFLFKTGKPAEAIALTTEVLSDPDPMDWEIREALRLWREYGVGAPDPSVLETIRASAAPSTLILLAEHLVDTGRPMLAKEAIDNLQSLDALAIRAKAALAEGESGQALTLAEQVLQRDEGQCMALAVKAAALLDRNEASDAVRHGQQAAAECPDAVFGWRTTALAYAAQDDVFNARRVFRDGVAANPQDIRLATAYTQWLLRHGRNREAVAAARRLTNAAPALSSGWRLYAAICRRVDAGCEAEAEDGLSDAKTAYGIDLKPGELPPNGLFGRFVIR